MPRSGGRQTTAAYDPRAAFAHPLTEPFHLPLSPFAAADVLAALVLLVAFAVPAAPRRRGDRRGAVTSSWEGSLSLSQVATRAFAVGLLLLAIAAGRLGADDELDNLAPALVVGAAWPLLVLASVVVGPVWRWLDPWDGIARALARGDREGEPGHVWPAAVVALAWVWYLSVSTRPLDPRAVGAVLALYTVVTVAGCLTAGRVRWLSSSEPLGILLAWLALLPRGELGRWQPPRGAEWLLGALAGGVLFGAVRRSELWGELNTVRHPELVATAGLLAACALVGGLLALVAATAERAVVARGAVPAVAGVIVAVAMDSNRLSTSVQLLPRLVGDPFGRGWDLFGGLGAVDAAPFGITGLLVVQLAILAAGYLAGAVVVARGTRRGARAPVAAGSAVLAGVSVIAIATH